MGELTAETFADWLHPGDVVNHFYQQGLGDDEAEARTLAMLSDGLLRAGAGQLIVNGHDRGLSLIPRDMWPVAGRSGVWTTGRFRFSGQRENGQAWSISAYDVRIDRDMQPPPPPVKPPAPPVTSARQGRPPARWWDDLWIEICRQIYAGDLKPDSQAIIARAMHEWLASQGIEAGDTTIRDRARRLHQALMSDDGNVGK